MEESGKPKFGEFIDSNDIKNNYYTKNKINSMINGYHPKILTPIGGKIFYDAGDNGATYTFYNSSGNVITDTSISGLQNAVKYKVEGTPTKDRYYVIYPSMLNSGKDVYWGFSSNGDINGVPGGMIVTGTRIGTGKTNTRDILDYISVYASGEVANDKKPGSLITHSSSMEYNLYKNCGINYEYLWDTIGDANSNFIGGHNDWFIPSKDELNQIVTSGVISSITDSNIIWSSSAYSNSGHIYVYDHSNKSLGLYFRNDYYRCIVCRAF